MTSIIFIYLISRLPKSNKSNTYSMGSCLERCPVEVINAIVESMELHDLKTICNLRLACRTLAAKTSLSHHFQALFKSEHVELKGQVHDRFRAISAGHAAQFSDLQWTRAAAAAVIWASDVLAGRHLL